MANVGGVFVGLLGGLAFSFIVALFEFFWRAMKSSHSTSVLCTEMVKEIKFAISCSSSTKEIKRENNFVRQSVTHSSCFNEENEDESSARASGRVTQLSDQQLGINCLDSTYSNRDRSGSILSNDSFLTVPPPPPPPMATRASVARCKSIREEQQGQIDVKSHRHLFYTSSSSPVAVLQSSRRSFSSQQLTQASTPRNIRNIPVKRQVSYDCTFPSKLNRSAQSVKFTRTYSK